MISTQLQCDFNLISTSFQAWRRYDVVMMSFFLVKTTSEIRRRCDVVLRLADVTTWFQPHIHVETTSNAKKCLLGALYTSCVTSQLLICASLFMYWAWFQARLWLKGLSEQCLAMKCNYYNYIVYLYPTVKFQIVEFSLGTCHFPCFHDIELL